MEQKSSEWLKLAKADLESALILIESKKYVASVSIYLSHQSVEKCFKYILYKHSATIIKTHDLMKLLSEVIKFTKVFNDNLYDIQELDQYFPKSRYPTGDRFTKNDAKRCFNIAKMVFQLTIEGK